MRRRAPETICCLVVMICGLCTGARGETVRTHPTEPGLTFFDADSRVSVQAPVLSTLVDLEVSGLVASGRVTQIFYNPTDEWVSGVYVFPLPEDAAVDRMRWRAEEMAPADGDFVLEWVVVKLEQPGGEVTLSGWRASLVAVDIGPTRPPGAETPVRQVPVHRPRDSRAAAVVGPSDLPVEIYEELVVTSETPLIETSVTDCFFTRVANLDDLTPAASEPWSLVARAPGFLVDRELGGWTPAPRFHGIGSGGDQNEIWLDGFEVTEDSSGESSFDFGLLGFREVDVISGGGASISSNSGLRIDLRAEEGTNTWQGTGRFRGSGRSIGPTRESASRGRVRGRSGELQLGGPLRQDRLWSRGAVSASSNEREVPGGHRVDVELEHAMGKLEFGAPAGSTSLAWHRGETEESGRGARPGRAPIATWNHESRSRLLQLDTHHVATANLVLTAGYGELDRRMEDLPKDGLGGIALTDSAGVAQRSTYGRSGKLETDALSLGGDFFTSFSQVSSFLTFGGRLRRHQAVTDWFSGHGLAVEAGENLGLMEDSRIVTDWRDASERSDLSSRSLWLQDQLTFERVTLSLGLRVDEQRGESRIEAEADPWSRESVSGAAAKWRFVAPRVGLTVQLTESGRALFRAGYGRFASKLGPVLASRRPVGFPLFDVFVFTGDDFDLSSRAEANELSLLFRSRPDFLSRGLGPEITDEVFVSFEHEVVRGFVMGLNLTHRRTRDVLERRILVRDGKSDEVFPATAEDWIQAATLTGQLPGGEPYRVSTFDLRPGLELMPSGLWVNGDRSQEVLAATLAWRGRLGTRWQTRGHFTWNDERWRLGPEFLRFDDPTDLLGAGDEDQERVTRFETRNGLDAATVPVDSRWSYHLGASVKLPRSFDLGIAINGREGYPLPYFQRVARDGAGIARVELSADAVRSPDVLTLDARLAKEVTVGGFGLTFSLESFNLLGAGDVLLRETDLGIGRGGSVDEVASPRVLRLGFRLAWR